MENKHYKLYKSGKNWVVAAITSITLLSGSGLISTTLTVHAATPGSNNTAKVNRTAAVENLYKQIRWAQAYKADNFTPASYAVLKDALDAGLKTFRNQGIMTTAQLNAAKDAMHNAALKLIDKNRTDAVENLYKQIRWAQAYKADNFTPDSYAVLKDALDAGLKTFRNQVAMTTAQLNATKGAMHNAALKLIDRAAAGKAETVTPSTPKSEVVTLDNDAVNKSINDIKTNAQTQLNTAKESYDAQVQTAHAKVQDATAKQTAAKDALAKAQAKTTVDKALQKTANDNIANAQKAENNTDEPIYKVTGTGQLPTNVTDGKTVISDITSNVYDSSARVGRNAKGQLELSVEQYAEINAYAIMLINSKRAELGLPLFGIRNTSAQESKILSDILTSHNHPLEAFRFTNDAAGDAEAAEIDEKLPHLHGGWSLSMNQSEINPDMPGSRPFDLSKPETTPTMTQLKMGVYQMINIMANNDAQDQDAHHTDLFGKGTQSSNIIIAISWIQFDFDHNRGNLDLNIVQSNTYYAGDKDDITEAAIAKEKQAINAAKASYVTDDLKAAQDKANKQVEDDIKEENLRASIVNQAAQALRNAQAEYSDVEKGHSETLTQAVSGIVNDATAQYKVIYDKLSDQQKTQFQTPNDFHESLSVYTGLNVSRNVLK